MSDDIETLEWCPCCLSGLDEIEATERRGEEPVTEEVTCADCEHCTDACGLPACSHCGDAIEPARDNHGNIALLGRGRGGWVHAGPQPVDHDPRP